MSWFTWPLRILAFLGWFTKEVITANFTVLRDNLTPGQDSSPGIARVPTRCRSDLELTLLAAFVTLTPGTLTMGTDIDPTTRSRVLFVHGMYASGPEELRAETLEMESRMLTALRRTGGSE